MASPRRAWREYFYPGTDVLRNKLDIRDPTDLNDVEFRITADVIMEFDLGEQNLEGSTVGEKLQSAHRQLFGKIYDWAGEFRNVDISKGGHTFGDHLSMSMYMRQADRAIKRFDWANSSLEEKLSKLAKLHTDLNFAHPFREGNGRSTTIFMEDLAAHHGVSLDFNTVEKERWNRASSETFLSPDGTFLDDRPMRDIYHEIGSSVGPQGAPTGLTK